MDSEKRLFLVCYEYGMGALWGLLHARSEDEIYRKYPELEVATQRPEWMSDEYYAEMYERLQHDIDEVPPRGILDVVVAERSLE